MPFTNYIIISEFPNLITLPESERRRLFDFASHFEKPEPEPEPVRRPRAM
jgi:hypothetical protein